MNQTPALRTVLCGLLLSTLLACNSATPTPTDAQTGLSASAPLRVMSYNIRYNNAGDGVDAWPNRADRLAAQVRFHLPDLGGMQEVLADQLADLQTALPEYRFVGVGRDDGAEAGEFSPIFYREDRVVLEDWGTYWLSETPEVVGSVGWDASLPRIVTWARLLDLANGQRFYLFNTHFDHKGSTAQEQSALLIRDKVAEHAVDLPFLITGDFNVTPDSNAYAVITEGDSPVTVLDARSLSETPAHGPEQTYWGFDACPGWFDDTDVRRLDYIFGASGNRVLRYGTLAEISSEHYLSDHMAIVADVILAATD